MSTDIYIVSGFLGAGKTTLIQKFLNEAFKKDKVVLIENDFGEISADAEILKSEGVEVKEINSGCICCSLQGDFMESIVEIMERFNPDKIIIEPSGVAKVSDIVKACLNQRIAQGVKVKEIITAVDVEQYEKYIENFGEFFEDQIKYADVILLSRTEAFTNKVGEVCGLINDLNPYAFVFSKPWDQINVEDILFRENKRHEHEAGRCEHGLCGHEHEAEEIFDTFTIYTNRVFEIKDLQERIIKMEQITQGKILRLKGILKGVDGYMHLQYIPGDVQITKSAAKGGFICIIGSSLDKKDLIRLFDDCSSGLTESAKAQ